MFVFTTSMPTPRPEMSVTSFGGREAGREDQVPDLVVAHRVGRRRCPARAPSRASCRGRGRAPSSLTSITIVPPWCAATSMIVPARRLPARERARPAARCRGRGVAHQVRERIDDLLDQALVELGRLAAVTSSTFLPSLRRDVAHQAREAAEDDRHRHHADRHHRFLQVARVALELRHAVGEPLVQRRVERAGGLREHRLRDHQLADQVDQLIDLLDRDAQLEDSTAAVAARAGSALAAGPARSLRPGPAAASVVAALAPLPRPAPGEDAVARVVRFLGRAARRAAMKAVARPRAAAAAPARARRGRVNRSSRSSSRAGCDQLEAAHAVGRGGRRRAARSCRDRESRRTARPGRRPSCYAFLE